MGKSKKTISQQLEVIITALKTFEGGASLEEIKAAADLDIELRTLQRRLRTLQKQGLVNSFGSARATRYHLALPHVVRSGPDGEDKSETEEILFPLSDESKKILALVSRPNQQRTPVGYHREFLELYQPNLTSYLTAEETRKLFQLGCSL